MGMQIVNQSYVPLLMLSLVAATAVVHIALAMVSLFHAELDHHKKSPYDLESDVKERALHIHDQSAIDLQLKEDFQKRSDLNRVLRSHLAARREILEHKTSTSQENSAYTIIGRGDNELSLRCSSCSLVGTSGTLTGSGHGKEIDSGSCVFRLGISPTRGFEDDVGQKTTVRVVDGNRLLPFLKKPQKLITGPWPSNYWFIFNVDNGHMITRINNEFGELKRQHEHVKIYRFSRKGEHDTIKSLRENGKLLGYSMVGSHPSTLWHTVKIMNDVGCSRVNVFGIPDPKYCKRNQEREIKTRFWDYYSPAQCSNGTDAGHVNVKSLPNPDVVSIVDRRGLLAWSATHDVFTSTPSWPQLQTDRQL